MLAMHSSAKVLDIDRVSSNLVVDACVSSFFLRFPRQVVSFPRYSNIACIYVGKERVLVVLGGDERECARAN